MALETNGQIVIGGGFRSFNGAYAPYITRLNSDGSIDPTFSTGVGPNQGITCIALRPDGEILIAGGFGSINGVNWNQPALLRVDGSVDLSFNTSYAAGAGSTGGVSALALQPDGKVLIAGGVLSIGGTNYSNLARLNTNGTLDGIFSSGTGAGTGYVNALAVQSTGQILVGGPFTQFNGVSCNGLVRLNSDGSVDTTFNNTGLQDGYVSSFVVVPQGQIVICGPFTSINGYSRSGIARLNADGTLDTTFDPGLGVAGGQVLSASVQTDGKVVIGGQFTAVDNTSRNGVARLNTNGTLDVNFNPYSGYPTGGNAANCVVSHPNGETLVCGGFFQFNGTNINGIARLNGDGASPAAPTLLNPQFYYGMSLSGTLSNTYRIEWTANLSTSSLWTPLFDVILQTNPQFIVDSNAPAGNRFYRAVQIAP